METKGKIINSDTGVSSHGPHQHGIANKEGKSPTAESLQHGIAIKEGQTPTAESLQHGIAIKRVSYSMA